MDIRSFLSRIVQLEIRIRKAINTQMHGNFSSVFKGSGLEFSDLRQYHYGDDIRHIDWNTTAKGHGTYVKLFKEEKEQTVFFLIDVSSSLLVGRESNSKLNTLKEVSGVLAFSAIEEAGHIGLCAYSDKIEKFMAPGSGKKHGYRVISELFKLNPENTGTDLKAGLRFALQTLNRKSLLFVLSDFLDEGYEDLLKAAAKKHDLIVIQLHDASEVDMPNFGIIPIFDPESNTTTYVNTASKSFKSLLNAHNSRLAKLKQHCKEWQADYVSIQSGKDFIPALVKLFRVRR
jgi:uncharacterized protein (DUF58 family)